MRNTRLLLSVLLLLFFSLYSSVGWGQTSTQDFGSSTSSNTSQTGSTSTIPNPTSGTTYARAGATAPNAPVAIVTSPSALGTTGSCLKAVSSTSASVTKASPIVSYTASTEFYTSFKVLLGDASASTTATSGIWTYYQGLQGTNYNDNNDVSNANTFVGLRFTFGSSGSLTLTFNNAGSYNSTGLTSSSYSQGTVYTIEIVGNNKTSGTISYTYNGNAQTVAVQKYDLYINGTLVGNDLAKGGASANTNINAITWTGVSSTSNAANLFTDNIVVYNAVPSSIGATSPTAPSISSITPGNSQLSVAFTAGSDGGSAITNYKYSTNGGSSFTACSPAQTTSPIVITGLINGTSYNVQIKAVNLVGDGTATGTTAATPFTTPSAPSNVSITPSNGQLSVAFTAGNDGGSAITNYKYSTNGGSSFTACSPVQTTSPIVISGLTNGTSYNIQIKAVNAAGDGTATSSTSATPYTTPSAPTINSITPTSQQLSVDFTAGATGGNAITTYKYSTDGGAHFITRQTGTTGSPIVITTSSVDGTTALSNGTTYDVQILAVNAAGDGSATSTTQSTPAAPASPTILGAATATSFTTTYGTASTAQTFSVSGTLLSADITATAPTGFEVSSDGSTYGSTASFTQSSGNASGTLYIRLAATATVSGSYNSLNIALTSTGASTVNIATAASGNAVSAKGLTITGLTGVDKTYDATTSASATGTPSYSGLVNSESFSVTGTPSYSFATKTVGSGKAITVTGFTAPTSNYSVSQPTSLTATISQATLTVTSPTATTRAYDGTTNVTVSGTLSGILLSDVVTLSTTGTIASASAGTGKTVTFSISGTDAANYSLTQPGTTVDIAKANQTITFGALTTQNYSGSSFSLTYNAATTTSGLTISYASDNSSVATVSGATITVVGYGTAIITASQAGDGNYNAASSVQQTLTVNLTPVTIVTFPSTWSGITSTAPSSSQSPNLNGTVTVTRGSGLTATSSSTRYSSSGWPSGSSLTLSSNNSYLTFTATAASGYTLNLNSAALNFTLSNSNSGPTKFGVYSSVGGFTSTSAQIGADLTTSSTSVTFPSSGYDNLSTIEIRIYGWNATNGTGTGGFGTMNLTGNLIACGGTTPTINTQPSAQSICTGSTLNLSVSATNAVSYQWRLGGTNISGATNSTYSVSNATSANAGSYDVIVTGNAACAKITSSTAAATVSATSVGGTATPASTLLCSGSSTTVSVTGSTGSIQWQSSTDGTTWGNVSGGSGATTATYTTPALTASTYYRAVVTSGVCASATSTEPLITINPAPTTSNAGSPQTICSGLTATLAANTPTNGTGTWSVTSGPSTSSLQFSSTSNNVAVFTPAGGAGSYVLTWTIANAPCTASTSTVTITVNPAPSAITLSTTSTTICNGGSDILLVASGGTVISQTSIYSNSSGSINLSIPDNSSTGVNNAISVSGIPSGATVDSVIVTFNVTHTFSSDVEVNLKAPNGQIINLVADRGSNSSAGFVNTRATSVSSASAFSTGSNPFTGTFKADGTAQTTLIGSTSITTSTFSDLFSTTNGNWTISAYDDAANDNGTLVNWSIKIAYTYTPQSSFSWTPTTGLSPTTGDIVSASPTVTTIYTVTSTVNGCSSSANDTVTVNTNTWTGSVSNSWNNSGNWSCGIVPTGTGDILISSGSPTLDVNLTLASGKNLTINGSGTLKVAPTKTLTIQGTANWNGKSVTFQSDNTGTAKLAQITGTLNGATNVTVERYVPAKGSRKYSFLASPVTQSVANSWQTQIHVTGPGTGGTSCQSGSSGSQPTTNSNGFDASGTNAPTMFYYDQTTTPKWNSIANTSVNLTPGTGYRVLVRGTRAQGCALLFTNPPTPNAVTLSATGTVGQGTFTVPVSGVNNGFTLLGNPYPADLNFTQFQSDNSGVIANKFWAYSPEKGAGVYATYVPSVGNANFSAGYANHQIIASGQAFFVENISTSNTVSFNEAQKAGTQQTGMFKNGADLDRIRVSLYDTSSATNSIDEALIDYSANGSLTYTQDYDARSMNSGKMVATMKATDKMAIQSRPTMTPATNDTVALFVDGTTANYNLGFTEHTNFIGDVYLLDKFNNTLQDIKATPNYAFAITADTNTKGANRFALVFKALPCKVKIKTVGGSTVCEPNAVQFVIDSNAAAYTNADLQWNLDGAPITGETNDTYSINAASGGNVSLTISWTGCNKTSNNKSFIVKPQPTAAFIASGATTFCAGGSVTLTAPSISGYSYTWYNNGTSIGSGASKIIKTAGDYTVVAKLNGCSSTPSNTATVQVNPLPIASIAATTPTTFCAGDICTMNATPTGGTNYSWINGAITENTGSNASFTTNVAGKFKVIVTDNNGCVSKTSASSITTKVNPIPTATINAMSSTTISSTGNVKLNAMPSSGVSWQWYKDGTPIANATAKQYIATTGGNYAVAVTKTGCTGMSIPTVVTQTTTKQEIGTTNGSFVISAYPNPVSDVLTVDVSGIQNPTNPIVEIMNSMGQQVAVKALSSTVNCELSTINWSSGIYFVRYKDDEGRTGTIKIIKD